MKKVKVISDCREWDFEELINYFISNHEIINIEFRTNGENQVRTVFTAFIVYEDD